VLNAPTKEVWAVIGEFDALKARFGG